MKNFLVSLITAALVLGAGVANAQVSFCGYSVSNTNDTYEGKDRGASASGYTALCYDTPIGVVEIKHGFQLYHQQAVHRYHPVFIPQDRPYAGVMNLTAAIHREYAGMQVRLAFGVDVVGPQTGVSLGQIWIHKIFKLREPDPYNVSQQVGNAFYLVAQAEVGRVFEFGSLEVRPFIEGRIGIEDYFRGGFDIAVFGGFPDAVSRDFVTGNTYGFSPEADYEPTWHLIVGADVTHRFNSGLYEGSLVPFNPTTLRGRVQMGYGNFSINATYLSADFISPRSYDQWTFGIVYSKSF